MNTKSLFIVTSILVVTSIVSAQCQPTMTQIRTEIESQYPEYMYMFATVQLPIGTDLSQYPAIFSSEIKNGEIHVKFISGYYQRTGIDIDGAEYRFKKADRKVGDYTVHYKIISGLDQSKLYYADPKADLKQAYSIDNSGKLAMNKYTFRSIQDVSGSDRGYLSGDYHDMLFGSLVSNEPRALETTSASIVTNSNKPESVVKDENDFKIFWEQFKSAIESGNKNAVAGMVKFPFRDEFGDVYGSSVTCWNSSTFISNYHRIFTNSTCSEIKNDNYTDRSHSMARYESINSEDEEFEIGSGQYSITGTIQGNIDRTFIFEKVNGQYKLVRFQYFE